MIHKCACGALADISITTWLRGLTTDGATFVRDFKAEASKQNIPVMTLSREMISTVSNLCMSCFVKQTGKVGGSGG